MTVTQDEVAARAGVSRGTVSIVLNNRSGARIGADTRHKIRMAADELGYEPNLFARSLSMRHTKTIGVIIPGVSNAFFANVMDTAERCAEAAGYQALLDAVPASPKFGDPVTHKLRGWQFAGLLIYSFRGVSAADIIGKRASRTPVVYLGYPSDDAMDSVSFDLYSGGKKLAEHLLERGYRRLAFMSPFDPEIEQKIEPRYLGCADACNTAGVKLRFVRMSPEGTPRQSGLDTAERLAREPADTRPDAIVCHNDAIAIGAHCGMCRAGLRVPEDIAIAGFDGLEEGQFLVRPLTTVHTPLEPFCAAAIDLLDAKIRATGQVAARKITIPTILRIGGTT